MFRSSCFSVYIVDRNTCLGCDVCSRARHHVLLVVYRHLDIVYGRHLRYSKSVLCVVYLMFFFLFLRMPSLLFQLLHI